MPNPPSINLLPGVPQAFGVIVTANGVQPDGSNPGQVDNTSPLVFEPIQNSSGSNAAVVPTVDPVNNRRVICTPGALNPGVVPTAWSFRVKVVGRTATVTVTGSTAAPPDVSGVTWDGNPVGPA